MKKIVTLLFCSVCVIFLLNGCNSNVSNSNISNQGLLQYKDSYIGDNSAVVNIVRQLPESNHFDKVELHTNNKPYGMTLYYNNINTDDGQQKHREIVVHNATWIFTLVSNADWITFHIDDQEYNISKEKLQNWYGLELRKVNSEDELNTLINEKDKSEINLLFEQ